MKKDKYKVYRYLSIFFIILSVAGFIVSTQKKDKSAVMEERGSSKEFKFNLKLESNHNYFFSFWVVDEETGFRWAEVSSYAEIIINDSIIHSKTIDFSESEETGGIKRAQNGFDYNYKPNKSTEAVIKGVMYKGDYWEIKIYDNISEVENIKPGLFIILFIVSLFLFLKLRKSKNS